ILFVCGGNGIGQDIGIELPRHQLVKNGPGNRDLVLFESEDGQAFTKRGRFVERAGVPCVIRTAKDRLQAVFQWFPFERSEAFDKVAAVFSGDDGETWSKPESIVIDRSPQGAHRPFDPTLVLIDASRVRLYFTSTTPNRPTPGIYSAVSDDGIHYRFESGLRFGVEGEVTVDASVARFDEKWHLFSPIRGPENRGYHAISEDGLSF